MVLFTLEMLLGMVFNNIKHFKSKVVGQLKGIILHINKKRRRKSSNRSSFQWQVHKIEAEPTHSFN
jgi:hypothetical protein